MNVLISDNMKKKEVIKKEILDGFLNGIILATEFVRNEAKKRAPVNVSVLRNSITAQTDKANYNGEVFVPMNSPAAKYAVYVEYGTKAHAAPAAPILAWAKRKFGDEKIGWAVWQSIKKKGTDAQPYMRMALYDNTDRIYSIVAKEVSKALK